MNRIMTAILLSTVITFSGGCITLSRGVQTDPTIVIIDVSGEIGWIHAPVCYFSDKARADLMTAIEKVGLVPVEAPQFQLDEATIASLYDLAKRAKPEVKPLYMNFVLTFFFQDGESKTLKVDRIAFSSLLKVLPESVAERPLAMYVNTRLYNNP